LPHAIVEQQEELVEFCEERAIAFLPFFSLAIPGHAAVRSSALSAAAKKHGVTEAQVAIAWLLARSKTMLPIPGTSSPEHLAQNWNAREIRLDDVDLAAITAARSGE
jgi:pyridoxine 4-dehydrogenase